MPTSTGGDCELSLLSAVELASGIREGRFSSAEVVESCLDRIWHRDGRLHAWEFVDPDLALRTARARDRQRPLGRLHGVPVGVKDLFDTADMPTTYGSTIYSGHQPAVDAEIVARLRGAGAVILGKTVTTELGVFKPGGTKNPHDHSRTPGGSSSGSAAAVADKMVPLAFGTQTAGSITRPASYCGIFGYKPSFGLLPTRGVKACAPSIDTVGVFASHVGDIGLAMSAVAGWGRSSDTWSEEGAPAEFRVAFVRTDEWSQLPPATQSGLEATVATLGLPELELPGSFRDLIHAHDVVFRWEAGLSYADERSRYREHLSVGFAELLDTGQTLTDKDYQNALAARSQALLDLPTVFAQHDAVLAPAVLGEAPAIVSTGDPVFSRAWTLLGNPTVAVPGLRGPQRLPLGVQVVGPPGEDARTLAVARMVGSRLGGR
jgi:Asp-tRNA(Asn)/Glu-tRNA(Gln) amidotransferase A subunit family amidase